MTRDPELPLLIRLADWLLAREPDVKAGWAARLHRLLKLAIIVARQFAIDRGFSQAAALAFSTALTAIPLCALALFMLKLVFVERFNHLQQEILDTLFADSSQQVPRELMDKLASHIDLIGRGFTGAAILLVLVYSSMSTLSLAEKACNEIWEVERGRHYGQKLVNFLAFLTFGILVLAVLSSLAVVLGRSPVVGMIAVALLKGLRSLALFFMIFKFLPYVKVRIWPAVISALLCTLLWEWLRFGINFYVLRMFSHSPVAKVYGSVALIPITLMFIYLTWLLVLFGVELSYAVQNLDALFKRSFIARRHEQDCLLRLSILAEISRQFLAGGPPATAHALARNFNLAGAKGEEIAADLTEQGLLVMSENGTLHPAADPRHTRAAHVFRLLIKNALGKHIGSTDAEAAILYPRLLSAFEREFGEETLADLVPIQPKP